LFCVAVLVSGHRSQSALTFSDIAAFERNYFRFHELMEIGRTAQSAVVYRSRAV
jgi:hypothetical protein